MAQSNIPGIMGQPPVSLTMLLQAIKAHLERDLQSLTGLGYPKHEEGTEHRDLCLNFALGEIEEAHRYIARALEYEEAHLQQVREEQSDVQ